MFIVYDKGHHISTLTMARTIEQAWKIADEAFQEANSHLNKKELDALKKECRYKYGYTDYCDDAKIKILPAKFGETICDF